MPEIHAGLKNAFHLLMSTSGASILNLTCAKAPAVLGRMVRTAI